MPDSMPESMPGSVPKSMPNSMPKPMPECDKYVWGEHPRLLAAVCGGGLIILGRCACWCAFCNWLQAPQDSPFVGFCGVAQVCYDHPWGSRPALCWELRCDGIAGREAKLVEPGAMPFGEPERPRRALSSITQAAQNGLKSLAPPFFAP
jgi:hypothetical protein